MLSTQLLEADPRYQAARRLGGRNGCPIEWTSARRHGLAALLGALAALLACLAGF